MFEHCLCQWSASWPDGENSDNTTTTNGNCALPYFITSHKNDTHFSVSFSFVGVSNLNVEFSPSRLHGDMLMLSDQVMLSIKVVC